MCSATKLWETFCLKYSTLQSTQILWTLEWSKSNKCVINGVVCKMVAVTKTQVPIDHKWPQKKLLTVSGFLNFLALFFSDGRCSTNKILRWICLRRKRYCVMLGFLGGMAAYLWEWVLKCLRNCSIVKIFGARFLRLLVTLGPLGGNGLYRV